MSKPEQKESESNNNNIIGFFDIDDTLTKGNTTICFAQFLSDRGILHNKHWNLIQKDLTVYKNSFKDSKAYKIFAVFVLNYFAQGLKGLEEELIKKEAESFLEQSLYKNTKGYEIRSFSKQLVKTMSTKGMSVAVSGSPLEILIPISKHLGFNVLETTQFEKINGKFSGKVTRNLALDEEKIKVVLNYQNKNLFSRARSFAFGDSPHDFPLLKAVDNSFVIGENPTLYKMAQKNGWFVSKSGDDILGEVERRLFNES